MFGLTPVSDRCHTLSAGPVLAVYVTKFIPKNKILNSSLVLIIATAQSHPNPRAQTMTPARFIFLGVLTAQSS